MRYDVATIVIHKVLQNLHGDGVRSVVLHLHIIHGEQTNIDLTVSVTSVIVVCNQLGQKHTQAHGVGVGWIDRVIEVCQTALANHFHVTIKSKADMNRSAPPHYELGIIILCDLILIIGLYGLFDFNGGQPQFDVVVKVVGFRNYKRQLTSSVDFCGECRI